MSTAVEEVRSSKEVAVSPNDSKPDSEHGSSDYYIDPVKESRMMRKFDVCLASSICQPIHNANSKSRSSQSLPWDSFT